MMVIAFFGQTCMQTPHPVQSGRIDANGLVLSVRDQGRALEMLDAVMAGIAVILHNLDPNERMAFSVRLRSRRQGPLAMITAGPVSRL